MKLRSEKHRITDEEETSLEGAVRSLAGDTREPSTPPPAYWQNLPLRMNRAIDEATSGVAISLSWVARVAIPGVVAILSFLIGLRYYAPDMGTSPASVKEVAQALPVRTVDSLYVAMIASADSATASTFEEQVLAMPVDQAREYYVVQAGTRTLLEDLSEQEVRDVVARLGSNINL